MQFRNITEFNRHKYNKKLIYFTLLLSICTSFYFYGKNNACLTNVDYFLPNISPSCYYEPDTFATMVRKYRKQSTI